MPLPPYPPQHSTTPPAPVASTPTVPAPAVLNASATECEHFNVAWYRSQRFIALCQSTAIYLLGWLSVALSTSDWTTWKAMLVGVLGNVLVALKDWWNPNVVAPFAALNRNNTVPVVKP